MFLQSPNHLNSCVSQVKGTALFYTMLLDSKKSPILLSLCGVLLDRICAGVLLLAWMESIFFTAACMVLSFFFAFVTNTVDNTPEF